MFLVSQYAVVGISAAKISAANSAAKNALADALAPLTSF